MNLLGPMPTLGLSWLGLRPYREMLLAQERLVEMRQREEIEDQLLLLEHEPVYTLGRRTAPGDLLHDRAFYEARGISVEDTPRGGKVTYHGPGQLIAYPIVDLREIGGRTGQGGRVWVARFVEALETAMIRALRRWRVAADRIEGLTGLWVDESGPLGPGATAESTASRVATGEIRKIGSIGLKISRGVTSHGIAINVSCDLAPFEWINSCGIERCAVTSVKNEIERSAAVGSDRPGAGPTVCFAPTPEGIGVALAEELAEILGRDLEPVDPATLGIGSSLPMMDSPNGRAKA